MYVIAYDIPSDGIRTRVARVLGGCGERVQKSVFECDISAQQLDDLLHRLEGVLEDPDNGNVRVYRLCADCQRDAVGIGTARPTSGSDGVYTV